MVLINEKQNGEKIGEKILVNSRFLDKMQLSYSYVFYSKKLILVKSGLNFIT